MGTGLLPVTASTPEDLEILLKVSMFALSKLEYPILFRLRIADPVGPQSSCPMGSWAPRHFHRPCPASSQAQPRLEPTWKLHYCALAPERKRWISSSPVTSPWSLRVCSWGGIGTVIKSFFSFSSCLGRPQSQSVCGPLERRKRPAPVDSSNYFTCRS